jgi:hypothetical protein
LDASKQSLSIQVVKLLGPTSLDKKWYFFPVGEISSRVLPWLNVGNLQRPYRAEALILVLRPNPERRNAECRNAKRRNAEFGINAGIPNE